MHLSHRFPILQRYSTATRGLLSELLFRRYWQRWILVNDHMVDTRPPKRSEKLRGPYKQIRIYRDR